MKRVVTGFPPWFADSNHKRQLIRSLRTPSKGKGLNLANTLVEVIGLVFVVLGLALGVVDGDTLGGMVGISVGVATIVLGAFVFTDRF